jgi:hypothetical protein
MRQPAKNFFCGDTWADGSVVARRRIRRCIDVLYLLTGTLAKLIPMRSLTTVGLAVAALAAPLPAFPGAFVRHSPIAAAIAEHECLSLGNNMFDESVTAVGACRPLGFHDIDRGGGVAWVYGTYERRWLPSPTDTVDESEVVLFTRRRGSALQPVWHYRYERQMLRSVVPQVAPAAGGAVLLSIEECVNGTGGCGQSFALFDHGSWNAIRLAFLDSLNRRFPDGVRHGFHVDVRTLRGSLGLYSGKDANCCPSRTAEFSLRLRGRSLELVSLEVRRAD